MNEHEIAAVLTYCAGIDPRFNTADADQAAVRVKVWEDQLAEVPQPYAMDHVRRFYSHDQRWSVTPGQIRTAWGHELDRRESIGRTRKLLAIGSGATPVSDASRQVISEIRVQIIENQQAFERKPRHPRQPRTVVRDEA